jgi:hypothetical protein
LSATLRRLTLGGTSRTKATHVQHALEQVESLGEGSLLTRHQHGPTFKFLGATAAHADQMVVMGVGITGQLKAAPSIGQFELLEQPEGTEQPQTAVHGGQRHPAIATEQAVVHVLSAEVSALAELLEQGEHLLALGGEALAPLMEAAAQAKRRIGTLDHRRHCRPPVCALKSKRY